MLNTIESKETSKEMLSNRTYTQARTSPLVRTTSFGKGAPRLQAKLRIGPTNDGYEREADSVADQVMRMPAATVQRKCSECEKEEQSVQRKEGGAASGSSGATTAPPVVQSVLRGSGRPLDGSVRSFMEPRFGRDFGDVRIHTGEKAAESARSVNALAYTVGRDVVFGSGAYSPESDSGRRLIAHELTHVMQQAPEQLQRSKEAEKKCPETEVIPDDVYTAIEEAWKKSGHGEDTVTEHGGRIVNDSTGARKIRTGSGGGGSISLPAEQPGDTTTGTFHTHPYSKSEHSRIGVSFSGGDIKNFIDGGQGSVKYVGAGTCIFILKTLDQAKQDACKTQDIKKRWSDAFAGASGTFQEKVHVAVKAAIAGCGICYYQSCRSDDKSAIPKTANVMA